MNFSFPILTSQKDRTNMQIAEPKQQALSIYSPSVPTEIPLKSNMRIFQLGKTS